MCHSSIIGRLRNELILIWNNTRNPAAYNLLELLTRLLIARRNSGEHRTDPFIEIIPIMEYLKSTLHLKHLKAAIKACCQDRHIR